MTKRNRLLLGVCILLALGPGVSRAAVNLGNLGVESSAGLSIDGGIGGGGGIIVDDPQPPPPLPDPSVSDLEADGYLCTDGNLDEVECRRCLLEPASETYTCRVFLCRDSGVCVDRRSRSGIPLSVEPSDLDLWAVEFALGASSYWLSDIDGDGDQDLGALQSGRPQVAFSEEVYFRDAGPTVGNAPISSEGPMAIFDVNNDGMPDMLSVSENGHLLASIFDGNGTVSAVELTGTYCEDPAACLIGDVNGDGFADLIEVWRGAVSGQRPGDTWVSLGYEVPGFPRLPDPPAAPDTDSDGIPDREDSCIEVANPSQADADSDGRGNACDQDLNNDGVVDSTDAALMVPCLGAIVSSRPECAAMDFDDDGAVTTAEYFGTMLPAVDQPLGPSAADLPPKLELFSPTDGTIYETGTGQAWVAGWIPNVPAGDVVLHVNGQPVAVSGPDNIFSAFVPLLPSLAGPRLFYPILVEASRAGSVDTERRVVLVGDRTEIGARSAGALGARLTAAGMERLEDYMNDFVLPDEIAKAEAGLNGRTYQTTCQFGICSSGHTISNASIPNGAEIDIVLENQALRAELHIPVLSFDYKVHRDIWDCSGSAAAGNIRVEMRWRAETEFGFVALHELQDPVVTAFISVRGCHEGDVESGILSKLESTFNDVDDRPAEGQFGPIDGPISGEIESILRSLASTRIVDLRLEQDPASSRSAVPLAFSGSLTVPDFDVTTGEIHEPPAPQGTVAIETDLRFESVLPQATGLSFWLDGGMEPILPVTDFGGLDGAYQLPGQGRPALPDVIANGASYDIGAAITPNGLNEALDAVARAGFLSDRAQSETVNGFVMANFFGVGAFNGVPDIFEAITVSFGWRIQDADEEQRPPAPAPVVSGQYGPGNEAIDVHVAQLPVEFLDASNESFLTLMVDARVGVVTALDRSGPGTLRAIVSTVDIRDFDIVENRIGVARDVVGRQILCLGHDSDDDPACLIDGRLEGLTDLIPPIELPRLEEENGPETLELAPRCVERLADGTLLAQFDLLLPGEELSDPGTLPPLPTLELLSECTAPLTLDPTPVPQPDPPVFVIPESLVQPKLPSFNFGF